MANPAAASAPSDPARSEKNAFLTPLFTDRRVAAVLGLGFAQGIPFLLVYATQSAWLVQAQVPLATIGLMSELTIAYKLKFLWAPFLDRHDAPLIGRWLGRRRAGSSPRRSWWPWRWPASPSAIRPTGSPGRWRSPWRSAWPAPPRTW